MDNLLNGIANLITSLNSLAPIWTATATAIQNQTIATTAATTATTAVPKLKPEQPSIFDGNQQRVNAFINELRFYFSALKVTDSAQMITYALSKIKGGKNDLATRWADQQRTAIIHGDKQTPKTYHFADYIAFEKAFIDYFALRDTAGDAIEAITILNQGNNTAEEYLVMFNSYADLSGYNEPALLREYKRGLNDQLKMKVANTYPLPTTLKEWKDRSCEIDHAWRIERKENPRKNPGTFDRNPRGSPQRFTPRQFDRQTTPAPAKDPMAMDVDRSRNRPPMMKQTCFTCGKPGHYARECTDKAAKIRAIIGDATPDERKALLGEAGF